VKSGQYLTSIKNYSFRTSSFDIACLTLLKCPSLVILTVVSERMTQQRLLKRTRLSRWPVNCIATLTTGVSLVGCITKAILMTGADSSGEERPSNYEVAAVAVSCALGIIELLLIEFSYQELPKIAKRVRIQTRTESKARIRKMRILEFLMIGKQVSVFLFRVCSLCDRFIVAVKLPD